MFRTRKIRARAKTDGKTFDDIAREYEDQCVEFKFAERKVGRSIAHSTQPCPAEGDVETGMGQRKYSSSFVQNYQYFPQGQLNRFPCAKTTIISKVTNAFTEATKDPTTFVDKS